MIGSIWRVAQRLRARRRCVLGPGSLVYDPSRLYPARGDRSTLVLGAHTHVRGELFAFPGGRIEMGDYCYLGEQSRIWAARSIRIGNRVLIAHQVTILDNLTHPLDAELRHRQFVEILTRGHPEIDLGADPVVIEDDVWIGCGCIVLRGVRIGRGAILGAGSVLTADVPPFTVNAGNPAHVIRTLLPDERHARGS